ncbi:MATE family efflux transporter [Amphritea sp. HPY]|uniref:MATE family efflux transporter n=1 Tax=Amphritea sp. HPY TaxID=3421652 RepID=UPI003D7C36C5
MSSIPPAATQTFSKLSRRHELGQILYLAVPILIAQLSQTAMGFVDTIMAARVGAEDLAAVSLGASIWLPIMLSLGGVLMATTPLVAQLAGAGRDKESKAIFNQAMLIALTTSIIAWFILRNSTALLQFMGVSGPLLEKTNAYLQALSWGVPAIMFYQVCRSFCEGFGKTRPSMKIGILGLLCNIPLNYIFIYGKLGVPAMGGVGCGWATAIVMWIMAICGGLYLHSSAFFRPLKLLSAGSPEKTQTIASFLKLGLPIGFTLLIEVSMFCIIALLIARLGDVVIAAHQITLSFSGLVFMFPLSMALALTIRVGQQIGAGQTAHARFSATTGIIFTCCCAVISCILIAVFATRIASLYSDLPEIISLASSLLMIAAIFQIPDAIQASSAGALRGYKDTSVPLLMVFIAFWLIALPCGYILAFSGWLIPALGAAGFWYSLVLGLTIGAILLLSRFYVISKDVPCPTD